MWKQGRSWASSSSSARPTPAESTKACARAVFKRTEEGDDTLGPSISEIECERYFGLYKNIKFSVHLHMGPKMPYMYIMAYFQL